MCLYTLQVYTSIVKRVTYAASTSLMCTRIVRFERIILISSIKVKNHLSRRSARFRLRVKRRSEVGRSIGSMD